MAEVVVVGAGLAGLCCARRLVARGHRVEVFERARAPGGRLRAPRRDGFVLEPAGASACRADRRLEALVRELGLAEARVELPAVRAVLRAGRLGACDTTSLRSLLRSAPMGAAARARLPWLLLELFRARHRLDPERPEAAADLDGRSLAEHLRRLGEDAHAGLLTPALAALRGETPDEVSAGLGLLALRGLQERGGTPFALRGGMEGLARALAERLTLRLGWEVVAAEADAAGVGLRVVVPSGERVRRADAAVLAVSVDAARRLAPALPPAARAALDALQDGPSPLVVHLLFEKAPTLPAPAIDVPKGESGGVREIVALHATPGLAPPGAGALRLRLGDEATARLAGASDDDVLRAVREALAPTPLGSLTPDAAHVQRDAGRRARFGPGSLGALARLRAAPRGAAGRLVLPRLWQTAATPEGAVAAGEAAADAVEAAVAAGGRPERP